MPRHVLFPAVELEENVPRIVKIGGRSIGVLKVGEQIYAMRNTCPHRGAPLCLGRVAGTMVASRPGEYSYDPELLKIRCPWHGYEFRLDDGEPIADAIGMRVKMYEVAVEAGELVLYS
ncbi:MAG TPA: Rieske (2Fe-2S) protein [Solirubrobacteraceae bacterium]|jgi:3-phenylpropionate/trans-cinnamate dioxygenase ferredoxin subunit